ncbi:MAG: hypothetical protein HYS15_01065 [Candidatus Spechtbacteria bacterium]|nr:hypothetical protein [Candidatus Spechtbacteria bacterium]
MEGITISAFFRHILPRRFRSELVLVLDIGTFSVKALIGERKKEGYSIISRSVREYVGGEMNADGSLNVSGITHTVRQALGDLKHSENKRRLAPKKLVLGIGGGFVYGKTLLQTYIRDNPETEIDAREFVNIIQKCEQRSFEQIRKFFHRETERSELEVRIIQAVIQEIKIDGYEVKNPVGFKGKEVSLALFNAYIPKIYAKIFEDLASVLKLELVSIVSAPYEVFRVVMKNTKSGGDFILLDMGGSMTEVALARKGKLEDIRAIPMGGSSFTRRISESLKIGFWEAENIKRKLGTSLLGKSVSKKLEDMILRDAELFLHSLALILNDFSQVTLLPSRVYLYGGGSVLPIFQKLFLEHTWRDTLSFFAKPTIELLTPASLGEAVNMQGISDVDMHWTIPYGIAISQLLKEKSEEDTAKILRRSLRLIQS